MSVVEVGKVRLPQDEDAAKMWHIAGGDLNKALCGYEFTTAVDRWIEDSEIDCVVCMDLWNGAFS